MNIFQRYKPDSLIRHFNSEKGQYWIIGIISILLLVFTFPKFTPEVTTGLDGSEQFAFNYMFAHHIQFGTQVVFNYGPLGFICFPELMGHNVPIGILLICLVRVVFIYGMLLLGLWVNKSLHILHLILTMLLCNMMYLDMAFFAIGFISVMLYHRRAKVVWLLFGCFLSVLGLMVKSPFGTLPMMVIFSYSVYKLITTKKPFELMIVLTSIPLMFILLWFIIYHNLSGSGSYVFALCQFIAGNSSAMQLYAINHWGILFLAFLFFLLPLLFVKNELTRILYFISFIPLYACYKYSFAREEGLHQIILFEELAIFCVMFTLLNLHQKPLVFMLPVVSIGLLYANMIMSGTYGGGDYKRMTGVGNFIHAVVDYSELKKYTFALDENTLNDKKLDPTQLSLIGKGTTDCFPFELTYIQANNLNWDPRYCLQTGFAYTPWLDSKNASFIASAQAPQFYLWELEPAPHNNYSFDGRYMLNDDPQSMFEFYNHYKMVNVSAKTALFERSNNNRLSPEQVVKTETFGLNTWINAVPNDSTQITRAAFHFSQTLKGWLRNFFYKDQLYYIDYKLANGDIKSYRFIPGNSINGLWVNPLVLDMANPANGETVKSIRIRVSGQGCIGNSFTIDWKSAHFSL